MSDILLNLQHISVDIDEKSVLRDVSLKINKGETHVLMGPNGAGKSTLGNVVMGNPAYTLTNGTITFDGNDVTEEKADARAIRSKHLCAAQSSNVLESV